MRPEPFGALVYHFGTRRLSFLKTPSCVDVVQRRLEAAADVHRAALEARPASSERSVPAYPRALARLSAAPTLAPLEERS